MKERGENVKKIIDTNHMTGGQTVDIKSSFENYKGVIFKVETDLNFWKSFLTSAIKNYQNQELKPVDIFEAVFTVHNLHSSKIGGRLTTAREVVVIKTEDLETHRAMFFNWVMNLTILKCYNAMELFLNQAIWLKYFPTLDNPKSRKKCLELEKKIKESLVLQNHSTDTKNNRHLIEFLRSKSNSFNAFADNKMNVDLMTTWANFFELLSILRNVVAHQGTVITNDTLNEIKSKSRDIFERYFEVTWDTTGDKHISPKENGIVSLIGVMNDFVVNTVKFINGEKDFKFIGLISL